MDQTNKRTWLVMGFLVIFGLLNAAKFVQNRQSPPQELVIAYASHPAMALLYVAEENGYFAEQDLRIDFRQFASGKEALESMLKGEADLATAFETSFVRKIMEGEDIGAISTLHASDLNTQILAKTEKGISRPEDLRGKRIGVTKGTNAEFCLSTYLSSLGISPEETTLVDVGSGNFFEAFGRPDLDALALWNPYLNALEREHAGRVAKFASDIYTETSFLAGKKEVLQNRHGELVKLLTALVKAEELAVRDRQVAIIDSVNFLGRNRPAGVVEADIVASWNDFEPALRINNVLLVNLEREALWLKKNSLPQAEVPDFRQYLFGSPLRQVKMDYVTVY